MDANIKSSTFKNKNDDPGFLVAKGRFHGDSSEVRESKEKEHRDKLANAIYMAIKHHGYASVRAIGTRAIANAVRSITSASDKLRNQGVSLSWESIIEKGNLGPVREEGHVKNVSAYCFRVSDWKNIQENNDGFAPSTV